MADSDDEGLCRGKFENGHWIWDEGNNTLAYVSDIPPEVVEAVVAQNVVPTGAIEFGDDVDLIDQIRYRRRYQRKLKQGEANIITLQDVKDVALFTAPFNIMSPVLINLLHISTTERFLRALILYCQYYLQVANIMEVRVLDTESKVRTAFSDVVESQLRENLCDLRVLLAKEYSILLIGGFDTKKYHHMGPQKKRRSSSNKDARLVQTFLRMSVQIVWLALERKSFDMIELEVNRLIKSISFNDVEHNSKSGYLSKMSKEEKSVLLGYCKPITSKLDIRSPLMNEVFCLRELDFRMFGFGIVNFPRLTPRLRYMMRAVVGPEEELQKFGVTIGILGMPRPAFDTMLRPIVLTTPKERMSISTSIDKSKSAASATSDASESSSITIKKLYPDIVLPEDDLDDLDCIPDSFPEDPYNIRRCCETQRRRWQSRLDRLLHPRGNMPTRSRDRAMYREIISHRSQKKTLNE